MTTPEIVRLERIVAELREELARKDELREREITKIATNLENVTSELHGLTRRFENHQHSGYNKIVETSDNQLWDYDNEIKSGRY